MLRGKLVPWNFSFIALFICFSVSEFLFRKSVHTFYYDFLFSPYRFGGLNDNLLLEPH